MLKNVVSGYRLQWLLRCGNMALQIPCSRPYVECPFTMLLFLWRGRFYGGIIWWLMITILVKGYMSAGTHKSSDKLVSFCEQVLILYCCTKAMPTGTCRVFCLLVTYMLMSSIQPFMVLLVSYCQGHESLVVQNQSLCVCVASSGQLSLASLRDRLIEYQFRLG